MLAFHYQLTITNQPNNSTNKLRKIEVVQISFRKISENKETSQNADYKGTRVKKINSNNKFAAAGDWKWPISFHDNNHYKT